MAAMAVGFFGCGLSRRSSDALTKIFSEGFSAQRAEWPIGEAEISYMNQIPEIVQNLVAEVLSYSMSGNKGT